MKNEEPLGNVRTGEAGGCHLGWRETCGLRVGAACPCLPGDRQGTHSLDGNTAQGPSHPASFPPPPTHPTPSVNPAQGVHGSLVTASWSASVTVISA